MCGTGKSFLARILLAAVIKERVAANLIFDMHTSMAGKESAHGERHAVKGLEQTFPGWAGRRLHAGSRNQPGAAGVRWTWKFALATTRWTPEDIEALQVSLDLSDVQVGAVFASHRRLGTTWLTRLPERRLHPQLWPEGSQSVA